MRINQLEVVEVEFIPEELEFGKIYVSEKHEVTQHLCPCGCGNRVVLSLVPGVGWKYELIDGVLTTHPSVGSYDLECRSHYFIRSNKIVWL